MPDKEQRPLQKRSDKIVTSQPPQIDLYKCDLTFRADPHPAYARLRATSPIHRVTLPDGRGVWLVTRYEDAAAILVNVELLDGHENLDVHVLRPPGREIDAVGGQERGEVGGEDALKAAVQMRCECLMGMPTG